MTKHSFKSHPKHDTMFGNKTIVRATMSPSQLWQRPKPRLTTALIEKSEALQKRLVLIGQSYSNVVFASSLAAEDMVISAHIDLLLLGIQTITLDTEKLNPETQALMQQMQDAHPIDFHVFKPQTEDVIHLNQIPNFDIYSDVSHRKACCRVRKIQPLNRALIGADAWITGQRRSQSTTRTALNLQEWDSERGIHKFNPLFDWEDEDVWAYVHAHHLVLNPLYEQGYPSIGCEPCTRAIREHEDIRAGRWWWENKDSKECGLHQS